MKLSSLYFLFFCLLITFRDAFTQLLVSPKEAAALTPVIVLFAYCWTSTLLAWMFYSLRNRRLNVLARWKQLTAGQRWTFIKLGLATWIVYASTVWGIKLIGAPIFNVIDYAGMPLITVFAGYAMLRESIPLRRIVFGAIAIIGVILLFVAAPNLSQAEGPVPSNYYWYLGIILAMFSTVTTAYSSALQKRQITMENLYPDEVLLYRFPIPAVIMSVWLGFEHPSMSLSIMLALIVIAAIGVFLPLLLLCFGFMRATLGQFSRFLFLIPVLTWIVVPAMIKGELQKLSDWRIVIGAATLVIAFVVSEFMETPDD